MIRNETVFILGAGASIPYGFPSGASLVEGIIDGCNDETSIFGQMFPQDLRRKFSQALELSFAPSIDDFLEKRSEFMEIGKAAICSQLIRKEIPSAIARKVEVEKVDEATKSKVKVKVRIEGNWYPLLWGFMQAKIDEFAENKVSFITFNYDRSLEFFFQRSLMNYFGIDKIRANKIMEKIPIIHVHGLLGEFKDGHPYYRDYSPELTKQVIETSSKMIRLFHDKSLDSGEMKEKAKKIFETSKVICFLGLGYHPANIKRIVVDEFKYKVKMVGSSYFMGEAEKNAVLSMLDRIKLGASNQDCLEFLRQNFVPE